MTNLATKYRPKTFDDVVHQDSIITILKNQIETNEIKNAYLFCGGAGTGKTTTARIFANEINKGEGNPIEIDGASNNSVDNIREIIDNCKFKSLDGKYKVFIIDEVHMLSIGAFNALLKTLEEPPKNVVFILCTTDPQKIPSTILSRVQRFEFKRIPMNKLVDRLVYILEKEDEDIVISNCCSRDALSDEEWAKREGIELYTINHPGLEFIAKLADGGLRDAITLLDKAMSYTHELSIEDITEALGVSTFDDNNDLLFALLDKDTTNIISIINELYQNGKDLKTFIKSFTNFTLDILKYVITEELDFTKIPKSYEKYLDTYFDYEKDLLKILQNLNSLVNEVKWSDNPKSIIEMRLIGLCY